MFILACDIGPHGGSVMATVSSAVSTLSLNGFTVACLPTDFTTMRSPSRQSSLLYGTPEVNDQT